MNVLVDENIPRARHGRHETLFQKAVAGIVSRHERRCPKYL